MIKPRIDLTCHEEYDCHVTHDAKDECHQVGTHVQVEVRYHLYNGSQFIITHITLCIVLYKGCFNINMANEGKMVM